jgi:hypothetical protein
MAEQFLRIQAMVTLPDTLPVKTWSQLTPQVRKLVLPASAGAISIQPVAATHATSHVLLCEQQKKVQRGKIKLVAGSVSAGARCRASQHGESCGLLAQIFECI